MLMSRRRGASLAWCTAAVTAAFTAMSATAPLAAQTARAGIAVAPTPTGQPLRNASLEQRLAHVRRLLRSSPLIDGHNDLPWAMREDKQKPLDVVDYNLRQTRGMTDIARLRKGMVGGQFWSVYIPGEIRDSGYARVQLEQLDIARRVIERYPDVLSPAYTAADVRKAYTQGKIGSLLGMEGGHAIENSLGALRSYYTLGARYMTLTHNVTLDWADAAADKPVHGGLTEFGKEVVREMNRLGMLVDLSHVSPGTMSDALDVSEAPVIFSHSNARALTNVPRNVPDSILARMPKNGGVVMVTFVPGFVSQRIVDWGMQRIPSSSSIPVTPTRSSKPSPRGGKPTPYRQPSLVMWPIISITSRRWRVPRMWASAAISTASRKPCRDSRMSQSIPTCWRNS